MNTLFWKIRNFLRWSYIRGLLQTIAARFSVSAFGGVALTSELQATKYTFANEQDRQKYFEMKQNALQISENEEILNNIEAWANSVRVPVNFGVVSRRVVTNAFVAFVVDQLQTETSVFGDFKYHDSGVGTTAENADDTAIETTDGESRATGTQTESAANAYRSVGTISYTTTKAITEHGLFNDPTAGTLMDRSVFSAINVVNGDSIQFTYTLTLTAGG